jgi:type IX secretion system PorP/SprF family membrane protein
MQLAYAQQDAQFTMYMFNRLYYNPAYAAVPTNFNVSLHYRNQWANFKEAPVTQNLSAILPFVRNNFGIGLNVQNDQLGVTGNMRVDASFAYKIDVGDGKLSFGLSAGLQQYRINGSLNLENQTDNTFNGFAPKMSPDFGFGVYFNKPRYFAGLSAMHLNGARRSLTGYTVGDIYASVARHYYATAGYNIEITDKFMLTPSFISAFSESKLFANNFSTTVSLKMEYKEMIWVGTNYRTGDALNFFTGINLGRINADIFKENIRIGYAFDWTNGRIPGYNSGSHEIFISYEYVPKVKRMMPKFK